LNTIGTCSNSVFSDLRMSSSALSDRSLESSPNHRSEPQGTVVLPSPRYDTGWPQEPPVDQQGHGAWRNAGPRKKSAARADSSPIAGIPERLRFEAAARSTEAALDRLLDGRRADRENATATPDLSALRMAVSSDAPLMEAPARRAAPLRQRRK
jgi:hypothetical protein